MTDSEVAQTFGVSLIIHGHNAEHQDFYLEKNTTLLHTLNFLCIPIETLFIAHLFSFIVILSKLILRRSFKDKLVVLQHSPMVVLWNDSIRAIMIRIKQGVLILVFGFILLLPFSIQVIFYLSIPLINNFTLYHCYKHAFYFLCFLFFPPWNF